MSEKLRKKLAIDEYLQLIKEDKNLNMAYTSLSQYMSSLEHQLEEKNKIIDEKNKCLLEIAREEINFINYLKSKGIDFDNESWINELEEILERGKNGKNHYFKRN